jgi:hypothetical protein
MKQIAALSPWQVHAMRTFESMAEEQVIHARFTELVFQGMTRLGMTNAMLGALMGMPETEIQARMTGQEGWTVAQVADAMYLMGCHLDVHMVCDHS